VFLGPSGRAVARRNLWLSIPALALAFAVWMLWSVVVVHLPAAGFRYSTNQLFWLTALPALCGATLRIVYAFAVPVIGGAASPRWPRPACCCRPSASAWRCRTRPRL
jgi:NNP family nitrate/nitrite transporter-like MFS transporter